MMNALQRTRLRTLVLGSETASSVKFADVLALVSGAKRLRRLEKLGLSFVTGSRGWLADDVQPEKSSWFYDSWEPPCWPDGFKRSDLEQLFEVVKGSNISIEGDVLEAMIIEDEFEEEEARMHRSVKAYNRWQEEEEETERVREERRWSRRYSWEQPAEGGDDGEEEEHEDE
jgi:hypothetical protein